MGEFDGNSCKQQLIEQRPVVYNARLNNLPPLLNWIFLLRDHGYEQ